MVIAKQKVGSFAFRGLKQQGRITAWHAGERWGGGASDCDSQGSRRAHSASRRPWPGPQLAVTHASVCSEQEPAASAAAFQRAELIRVPCGVAAWSALLGWYLSCKDVSAAPLSLCFPPHLILQQGSAAVVGPSLRDKPQGHLAQPHVVFGCPV